MGVLRHTWLCIAAVAWLCGRSQGLGENYVGIGYNLLTANPDGGSTATGGVDPGLLITRHILNLGNSNMLVSQIRHSCVNEVSTKTFYGAKSYQEKLSVGVTLEGGVPAALASAKFSLSPRFQRAKNETSNDHKVFQDETMVCNLGRVRAKLELARDLDISVTDSFASSVCQLPQTYDQRAYMAFIDHWGTHMTVEVDVGTKDIERSQTSLSEYVRHVMKASGADVSLGGSYMGYGASLAVNIDNFKASDSYSKTFGSHQAKLTVGTPDMPEPIQVKLMTIDKALQPQYWDVNTSFVERGICDGSDNVQAIATNLGRALNEYAAYKMAGVDADPPLVVPLTWPRGTYGLPKASGGCPAGRPQWLQGFRKFDNNYVFSHNEISSHMNLAGTWAERSDIILQFCMKGTVTLSEFDVDWPAGDYCIFKYGTCPTGFNQGWVKWDDANMANHDSLGGITPDGEYTSNTRIDFCCRNDSMPTQPVYLPTERPFFLLRHWRTCQQVRGMNLQEETVQWNEEFHWPGISISKEDRLGGAHPYDDGSTFKHQLHFCYYTPPETAGHVIG